MRCPNCKHDIEEHDTATCDHYDDGLICFCRYSRDEALAAAKQSSMKHVVYGVLLLLLGIFVQITTIEIHEKLPMYWKLCGSMAFVLASGLFAGVPLMFGFMNSRPTKREPDGGKSGEK